MPRSLLTAFIATALLFYTAALKAGERPNVIFIAIDDMNDWPGFMKRYPDAITPNMDALAARGMVFTNAHCAYPLCGPSRACIFTGMSFPSLKTKKIQVKDERAQSIAERKGSKLLHNWFGDNGYKTMGVGKLLHKHLPKDSVDMSGGRGKWNKLPGGKKLNWPSDKTLTDWGPYPGTDEDMSDHQAATWAVDRLGESHDKPFMLMVGFLRPHVPWHVPQKWYDLYPNPEKLTLPAFPADDLDDVPSAAREMLNDGYPRTEWAQSENQWREIVHSYLACLSFVDAQVGRVLDALEKSPYRDNTIIVLWSDHGYHLGEKNTFQKHTCWDRSSRSPLIFAGPDVKPGTRCNQVVSLLDLYPTLVGMTGLPANDKVEGRSLQPLLANPTLDWPHPAIIHCRKHVVVQTRTHRYIRYEDGSEELYDHMNDPDEHTNLASGPANADLIATMAKHLRKKKRR